nr:glycosyltransferase [Ramlibacter cellulosilyticus]
MIEVAAAARAPGGFAGTADALYGAVPEPDAGFAPRVSVIVPNYNHAPYLRRRLDSIYAQTYGNVEVILLDDCSSDDSREILLDYARRHAGNTRTCFNEVNSGGVFHQWARALELATGELVWIAESDDYCEPNFLAELVRYFRNEAVMLAFARTDFVDDAGTVVWPMERLMAERLPGLANKPFIRSAHALVNQAWGVKNIVPNVSSALFRHPGSLPLLQDAKWRDLRLCGDWIFYLHLVRGGLVGYSPATKNYYRQHDRGTAFATRKRDTYYQELETVATELLRLYRLGDGVLQANRDAAYQDWCSLRGFDTRPAFDRLYSLDRARAAAGPRQPNILMVGFALIAGGGETFPITLANQLKRRGQAVSFLNFRYSPTEPGVRRMLRADVPLFELDALGKVGALCEDLGIEVAHSHHAWSDSVLADFLARQPGVRQVVTLHGMYEMMAPQAFAELLPKMERRIDRVVYTAEKNLRPFSADFRARKGFTRIDNALEPKDIHPVDRATLGIGEGDFVLCLVSRALREKGWEEAILAVTKAQQRSARTIHLVLIGEGEEYDRLKPVHESGTIHFLGFRPNIRDYFAMADMGFLPSRFPGESAPLVVIDSLWAGRPVIASRIGEIPRMLEGRDGLAGALFDLEDFSIDIDRLATVVAGVANDSVAYGRMRDQVPHAVRKFDPEVMVVKYESVYQEVAAAGRPEVTP